MRSIDSKELLKKIKDNNAHLIDVREIGEFEAGHIEGAFNIPLSTFIPQELDLNTPKDIIFICAVGQRSAYALQKTQKIVDRSNMYNLEKGIIGWLDHDYPIISLL